MAFAILMRVTPAASGLEKNTVSSQALPGAVRGARLFQRFTLEKILGRGGMSIVWLARDDRLDRLVALKLAAGAVCFDASARGELRREPRKSLLLTHPNIVRIFDFFEDDECTAISMEYVDGAALSALRLQKRANCFAVSEIAPWVTSLCGALAHAHESTGLIHGDLKPANLMVNSRMELKVTDFGFACAPRDSVSGGSPLLSGGTLSYMSPQQLLGEASAPTDDIYSVGATLYELLSSKPPFFDGDVAGQVREVTPPWVAKRREKLGIAGEAVPKYWEETIAACLAKNPADRPATAVDLARRLRLGGAIRVAGAQQESKTRALIHALTRARILGAAAGAAAMIAAAILVLRSSPGTVSKVKQVAEAAVPEGFAMELLRPDPGHPNSILEGTSAPLVGAPPRNGMLQLSTTPPGASFAIYAGIIAGEAAPESAPLRAGAAPESIGDLAPGRYTLFFQNEGWPQERTEVSLGAGETLPVEYIFPHGSANITSTPDGAEIFLGPRSLGHAPLTVDLPLGKQELTARHPDRPERSQMVTIESGAPVTVAFQLRAQACSSRAKSRAPESTFEKIGRSLKNFFSPKRPPERKKS